MESQKLDQLTWDECEQAYQALLLGNPSEISEELLKIVTLFRRYLRSPTAPQTTKQFTLMHFLTAEIQPKTDIEKFAIWLVADEAQRLKSPGTETSH